MKAIALKLFRSKAVRYLFTAGVATVVDVAIYFVVFNFILEKNDITSPWIVIGAPTFSLCVSFSCGMTTNFLLTRFFVFSGSDLKSGSQFFRYAMVAIAVLISNYYLMSLLIKGLHWYPTIARGFSAISIGVLSYLTHKTFSFRIKD